MNKKLAILRGVNVGGKRKVLMSDLKFLCETLNWKNVKTYIQSGNIVFNSGKTTFELEDELEEAITKTFGFDVPVIIRNSKELQASIDKNPFLNGAEITQLYLTFLKRKPTKEDKQKILPHNYESDKFEINGKDVFIFCSGKYHQSKLTNNFFEKKLNTEATTRNWKTILKLSEQINE